MPAPLQTPLALALARKQRAGAAGGARGRRLAQGAGWWVQEVLCTSGPTDARFEERHGAASVSLVLEGQFTYRAERGPVLLSPGALLLGNAAHAFECSHEHGEGDHCLSFQFEPSLLEALARDAGVRRPRFAHHRLPPLRALAPLVARAVALARGSPGEASLEELALRLGAAALVHSANEATPPPVSGADLRRVGRVLREVQGRLAEPHGLEALAARAGLSRFHFLRTFRRVTGVTPHQWLLRARLREAARRLATTRAPVTEVALEVGFQELSHFTRAFRAELGVTPGRFARSGR
ncbi:AraC family transcriptional regulator [Aggregicoccus sp. 17bor-14]|uniref:helix-turn-helix domain-containing protein n=1 Tax=Myxococcaceae TaxID=31 RepID=UPI00129D1744|nr:MULTISPECIES: AraC family transcriptional regulator [Myxococcaceae]MBF5044951.1 helix-turn-helix transcriptional regulator [Simulacricoccus sp. 17bor-14]MRI90694.1 AraC family transcriptional regulator [Aggregicoccus sp. 17bor-14]